MRQFEYLGLNFKPLKTLTGAAGTFEAISERITNKNDTPQGWNYDEFYKVAEKHGAKEIDLFEVKGQTRIPATNYLFYYK